MKVEIGFVHAAVKSKDTNDCICEGLSFLFLMQQEVEFLSN